MLKRRTSNCHRCGAVLQPKAEVCSTCCAPQTASAEMPFGASASPAPAVPATPAPAVPATPAPAIVAAPTSPVAAAAAPVADAAPGTGLGAWPFGQADAEAAAQVAAQAVAADVQRELTQYSAQSSTHVLSGIPAQRPARYQDDLQSVPSTGPNPFLAAARLQHAQDEAATVEGYPV